MTTPGPDWIEQARRFAAGLAAEHAGSGVSDVLGGILGRPDGGHPDGAHTGSDPGAECRWCPICAGLAALRGRRPDLLEALADVLSGAATALRTTAHTAPPHTTTPHATTPDGGGAATAASAPTAPPEETVPNPAPTPTVQRIDVA